MRIIVGIIFSILLSTLSMANPPGWKLSRDANGVKVWQLEKNSDVTGSLEQRRPKKNIDWHQIEGKEFFKKFEDKKKRILSLVGISDWLAENYKWKPGNKDCELEVSGNYTDASGQKVAFTEVHIYKPDKTIQILHTRPSNIPNGEKLASEIIDHVKKQVEIK